MMLHTTFWYIYGQLIIRCAAPLKPDLVGIWHCEVGNLEGKPWDISN